MKNLFTKLSNKLIQIYDSVRQFIFRQRKKDEGTKKETHRGKGGGSKMITANHVTNNLTDIKTDGSYYYSTSCNIKNVKNRRRRNKVARKSRRINRLHTQFRTKAKH